MNSSAVVIPEKLFFKIGEVCELAGVQAHVLRYWETEFPMFAPQKNRAGQRTYRRRDVEMALRIKELLYDEKYTIAGAKKKLATEVRSPNRDSGPTSQPKAPTRSLKPPPSLAAKFASRTDREASTEAETVAIAPESSTEPPQALKELAKELRDILNLLDDNPMSDNL